MKDRWMDGPEDEDLACVMYEDLKRQDKIEKDLAHVKDYMQGILNEIYCDDELDTARLYDYLEEIASVLEIDMPKRRLNLKREQIYVRN